MLLTQPTQTFGECNNVHVHGVQSAPASFDRPRGFLVRARWGKADTAQVLTIHKEDRWRESFDMFLHVVGTEPTAVVHLYHLTCDDLALTQKLLDLLEKPL